MTNNKPGKKSAKKQKKKPTGKPRKRKSKGALWFNRDSSGHLGVGKARFWTK